MNGYSNFKVRRRAAGLCIQCGEPKLTEVHMLRCAKCREKQRQYYRGVFQPSRGANLAGIVAGPRCACSLLLPCNACTPTARDMAERRVYE